MDLIYKPNRFVKLKARSLNNTSPLNNEHIGTYDGNLDMTTIISATIRENMGLFGIVDKIPSLHKSALQTVFVRFQEPVRFRCLEIKSHPTDITCL